MERQDDFQLRRKHLENLTDEELHQRFWQLTAEICQPMLDLAKGHTSPSVERSVLLRMGLSSIQAKELVDKIQEKDLLGQGAGHILVKAAQKLNKSLKETAQGLIEDRYWDQIDTVGGGD